MNRHYTQAIIAFLDSMSSAIGDVDSDAEIITAIVNGWEDPESKKQLANRLRELADKLDEQLSASPLPPKNMTQPQEPVTFGTQVTVIISPELCLLFADALQKWLDKLIELKDIDPDRETAAMAQILACKLVELSKIQKLRQ